MTRVLIIGDHAFSRQSLVALVNSTDDLEVVGDCDGTAPGADLDELRPHVIVMDVRASFEPGAHAGGHPATDRPSARVLMLTGDTSAGTRARVRARGASGYVIKGSDPGVVLDAIRTVAFGRVWSQDGDGPAAVLRSGAEIPYLDPPHDATRRPERPSARSRYAKSADARAAALATPA
jgi:DNA-binding NarL/FixJ family response regulator